VIIMMIIVSEPLHLWQADSESRSQTVAAGPGQSGRDAHRRITDHVIITVTDSE
jgi:hypothetical protein